MITPRGGWEECQAKTQAQAKMQAQTEAKTTTEAPYPMWDGQEKGGGEEAGRGWVITRIIPNQTAGTDGHRGRILRASSGGASQKESLADSGRQGSMQGVLEGLNAEKALEVLAGTVALCKICQFQKSTELVICKWPFLHLIHRIAQEVGRYDLHFQVCMVMALQEAAEYYLTGLQEDANFCTIHVKCITIMPKDIQLAHCIPGEHLQY